MAIETNFKIIVDGVEKDISEYMLTREIFEEAVEENPELMPLKWGDTRSIGGTLGTITKGKYVIQDEKVQSFLNYFENFGGWAGTKKDPDTISTYYQGLFELDPKSAPIPYKYKDTSITDRKWPLQVFAEASDGAILYVKWTTISGKEGIYCSRSTTFDISSHFITPAEGIFVMLQGAGGGGSGNSAWFNQLGTVRGEFGCLGGGGGGSGAFGIVYINVKELTSDSNKMLKMTSGKAGEGSDSVYQEPCEIHWGSADTRPTISNGGNGQSTTIELYDGSGYILLVEAGGGKGATNDNTDLTQSHSYGGKGGTWTVTNSAAYKNSIYTICFTKGCNGSDGAGGKNYDKTNYTEAVKLKGNISESANGISTATVGTTDLFSEKIKYWRENYATPEANYMPYGLGGPVGKKTPEAAGDYFLLAQGGGGGGSVCGYWPYNTGRTPEEYMTEGLGFGCGGRGAYSQIDIRRSGIEYFHIDFKNYCLGGTPGRPGAFGICSSWVYNETQPTPPQPEPTYYSIDTRVSHGTSEGVTSIVEKGNCTIEITPDTDYTLPTTVTVLGECENSYIIRDGLGHINLRNVQSAVVIRVVCREVPEPN